MWINALHKVDRRKQMDRCGTCKFYVPLKNRLIEDEGAGTCHRNPPAADGFSLTSKDAWCGEYMLKGEDQNLTE